MKSPVKSAVNSVSEGIKRAKEPVKSVPAGKGLKNASATLADQVVPSYLLIAQYTCALTALVYL